MFKKIFFLVIILTASTLFSQNTDEKKVKLKGRIIDVKTRFPLKSAHVLNLNSVVSYCWIHCTMQQVLDFISPPPGNAKEQCNQLGMAGRSIAHLCCWKVVEDQTVSVVNVSEKSVESTGSMGEDSGTNR